MLHDKSDRRQKFRSKQEHAEILKASASDISRFGVYRVVSGDCRVAV